MHFRTEVQIPTPPWSIGPTDRILCLGSCFAQRIGTRMQEAGLRSDVNPYGTLYNPASIARHIPAAGGGEWDTLILTLGTPHVFELDGEIVDNCQRRPSHLFTERDMSIDEIVGTLGGAIERSGLRTILTVSPYRYANFGHNDPHASSRGLHANQLMKARLLLAVDELCRALPQCLYFPAYEIVLDELRDYRFYDSDMLHPSAVAVEYIWERFAATMLSATCQRYVSEMEPVRKALAHRPSDPSSPEYARFLEATRAKEQQITSRYT